MREGGFALYGTSLSARPARSSRGFSSFWGPRLGGAGVVEGQGLQNGPKMRVDFEFTPNRAELSPGTPPNYPSVTPKDHHGTKGFFEFGVVEKLLRVLRASLVVLSSTWLSGYLYCIIL